MWAKATISTVRVIVDPRKPKPAVRSDRRMAMRAEWVGASVMAGTPASQFGL
jgi:hypothetical protein